MSLASVAAYFRRRPAVPTHGPREEAICEVVIAIDSIACGYDDDDSATILVRVGAKQSETTMREGDSMTLRLVGYRFDG